MALRNRDTVRRPVRWTFRPAGRSLATKALSLTKVLLSGDVSDVVYARRMNACRACEYCSESGGHLWCGCCGCCQWHAGGVSSSVEYKNRKAAWQCPGPHAAFEAEEGR